MEGTVQWTQVIFISGIIIASSGAGFIVAWRFLNYLVQERHDVKAAFEARTIVLDERINDLREAHNQRLQAIMANIEKRIAAVELFNASAMVVLDHMKDFRREVSEQLTLLRTERRADMDQIHAQLNSLQNLDRFNRVQMEVP